MTGFAAPLASIAPHPGLTGAEIALPTESAEDFDRRRAALEAEMKPRTTLAREFLGRIALMLTRLDRSARQESKALACRMRNAALAFDDARLAEVDHLHSWIAHEPATNSRRLRRSAEGLDRLIMLIEGLRSDLVHPNGYRWNSQHCDQLHNLLGLRREEVPMTRFRALSGAVAGKFADLEPTDAPNLDPQKRRLWAIAELVYVIDAEIAKLKELLATFDREAVNRDRAEAADRAMFDDSKEGILARKYEAATERGLFRALREFHEIQTETPMEQEVAAETAGQVGSFFPEASAETIKPAYVDPTGKKPAETVAEGIDDGPVEANLTVLDADPAPGSVV